MLITVVCLVLSAPGIAWSAESPAWPAAAFAESADRGGSAAQDTLRFAPADAETLRFAPTDTDTSGGEIPPTSGVGASDEGDWLRAPFGDRLLTDLDQWRAEIGTGYRTGPSLDYNRVDRFRLGAAAEGDLPLPFSPRIGGKLGYSFGRDRWLYGVQFEQPLGKSDVAVGVTASRVTDHYDLQQVGDAENSLALLFARMDYRDYFDREGVGGYASWRIPRMSTISLHARSDRYRSLELDTGTKSLFYQDRDLRENPTVDDGRAHTLILRLERLAHRTASTRAGFYHWIELERAGGGIGGDFSYTRLLLDLRSVVRVSPATTLMLRALGGTTPSGELPAQREFTMGGVDGLRAHRTSQFRGNQAALAQAEYTVGLWRIKSGLFEGGLHAIVFVDAGQAWTGPSGQWDIADHKMSADGGLGLSTSEDNLRVYFAHNLQKSDSSVLVSIRLHRPF
jgi:hypothetical protein